MKVISSHKAFSKSEEYALTQAFAAKSWVDKFDGIYYIGHYEEPLLSPRVNFVRPDGDYPTIKVMAQLASDLGGEYIALVNADIVLGSNFHSVVERMKGMALPAATSYRYEFDIHDPDWEANAVRHKEDRGMDIFIANPAIWRMVAKEIPEDLWWSHPTWDSWVCGWMCHHLGYGFRHFTEDRCVFHPKHGGRETPNSPRIKNDSPYFTRAKRPSPL